MSNSFNIVPVARFDTLDANIATIDTVVDANAIILVNVHDTDLPAVQTVVDASGAVLIDIHDTDLPAVLTAVNALESARGQVLILNEGETSVSWVEVLDIPSGRGKILYVYVSGQTLPDQNFVRITIDGVAKEVVFTDMAAGTEYSLCYNAWNKTDIFPYDTTLEETMRMLNYEFNASLKVEIRRPAAGSNTNGYITMCYLLD